MKTYIELSQEPKENWVFNGKTGVGELDKILPILYKKFNIFQIDATVGYKFPTGFSLEIHTHNNFQREVFGIIRVEYQKYTHKRKSGEDYYEISSHREKDYDEPVIGDGYVAFGNDFNEVLTAFLMETEQLLQKKINHMQENKSKLSKKHTGCYDTSKANFSYIEFC